MTHLNNLPFDLISYPKPQWMCSIISGSCGLLERGVIADHHVSERADVMYWELYGALMYIIGALLGVWPVKP